MSALQRVRPASWLLVAIALAIPSAVQSQEVGVSPVATAAELLNVIKRGDSHIEIRDHLDLTGLPPWPGEEYDDSPRAGARLALKLSTKSIRGKCSNPPEDATLDTAIPPLPTRKEGQCVLLVAAAFMWLLDDFDVATPGYTLWLDSLLVHVTEAVDIYAHIWCGSCGGRLWLTGMTFQGQVSNGIGVALTDGCSAYIEDSEFHDFSGFSALAGQGFHRCRNTPTTSVHVKRSIFANNQVTEGAVAVWVWEVLVQDCTFNNNSADLFVSLGGNYYVDDAEGLLLRGDERSDYGASNVLPLTDIPGSSKFLTAEEGVSLFPQLEIASPDADAVLAPNSSTALINPMTLLSISPDAASAAAATPEESSVPVVAIVAPVVVVVLLLLVVAAFAMLRWRKKKATRADDIGAVSEPTKARQLSSASHQAALAGHGHAISADNSPARALSMHDGTDTPILWTSQFTTSQANTNANCNQQARASASAAAAATQDVESHLNFILAKVPPEPFAECYLLIDERAHGGQAVIQFARSFHKGTDHFAIKFFNNPADFSTEFGHSLDPVISPTLPKLYDIKLQELVANRSSQGVVMGTGGFVFPPFLVMERGTTLAQWMKGDRQTLHVLGMIADVSALLDQLHANGRVHRDIKPDNVLMMLKSQQWRLIDFGIAANTGEMKSVSCTAAYAAPEIMRAIEASSRVEINPAHDVWALGVTVYECITGARAFDPISNTLEDYYAHARGDKKYPWERDEGAHTSLQAIHRNCRETVMACLHREPDKRPTASKIMSAIKRIGGGTTTSYSFTAGSEK